MRCPKCPGTMTTISFGRKISLRRCDKCGGLFCNPDVLLEMKREWMSELVIDSGDPKLGAKLDQLDDINCPECGIAMEKTSDPHQKHIWYERCDQCEGMFFDAGEFSDLKYDTLIDRVRDLVKGSRPAES